jgi:uncharacterized protein
VKRTELNIPCGEITLEAVWQTPEAAGQFPAVVICHPHPQRGGDLHNFVVSAISRDLVYRGIAALRFNFRGMGESGGTFGDGIKEQEDVTAALDFVAAQKDIDAGRIGLAGYSFGGGVAIPVAAKDARVAALALVSPAVMAGGWSALRKMKIPKLLVAGSEDDFFPAAEFQKQFANIPEPKDIQVIAGSGHFWYEMEAEVGKRVGEFFGEKFLKG